MRPWSSVFMLVIETHVLHPYGSVPKITVAVYDGTGVLISTGGNEATVDWQKKLTDKLWRL